MAGLRAHAIARILESARIPGAGEIGAYLRPADPIYEGPADPYLWPAPIYVVGPIYRATVGTWPV